MRVLLAAILVLFALPAGAAEVVAIGRIAEVTLLPEGTPRCPAACPESIQTLPTGEQSFCISNSCGCGETKIEIVRVLLGHPKHSTTAKYRLGEWCDPIFKPQPKDGLVIFRLSDTEDPTWGPLYSLPGNDYEFSADSIPSFGSINLHDLADKNGMVQLSKLVSRLGP